MGLLDMTMGLLGSGLQDQQDEPKAMLVQAALGMLMGKHH
jgi:hypothetical protein